MKENAAIENARNDSGWIGKIAGFRTVYRSPKRGGGSRCVEVQDQIERNLLD